MAIEDSLAQIEAAVTDIKAEIGQAAAAPEAAAPEAEVPAEDATETVEEPAPAGGPNAPFVPSQPEPAAPTSSKSGAAEQETPAEDATSADEVEQAPPSTEGL